MVIQHNNTKIINAFRRRFLCVIFSMQHCYYKFKQGSSLLLSLIATIIRTHK